VGVALRQKRQQGDDRGDGAGFGELAGHAAIGIHAGGEIEQNVLGHLRLVGVQRAACGRAYSPSLHSSGELFRESGK
jgi:hypothetical protein